MVLEEATASEEPAVFSEAADSSDLDPYSSNTYTSSSNFSVAVPILGSNDRLTVDLEHLPLPLSAIASSRARREMIAKGVTDTCIQAQKIIQRPLRQEEAYALAEHFAAGLRVSSYGSPIGVSVAAVWAYYQKDYRFPGWSPMKSGRFQPDVFGRLRGQNAKIMWNVVRYSAYGFIGSILGSAFFATYAVSLNLAHRAQDPRLKDFNEMAKQRQRGALMEGANQQQQPPGRGEGETMEMARQRRAAQEQADRYRQRQQTTAAASTRSPRRDVDDASPTGGAFADEFMSTSSDTGLMSDSQTREQQYRAENSTSTYVMRDDQPQPNSRAQQTASSATPQSHPSGFSSWEILRQRAMKSGGEYETPAQRARNAGSSSQEASQGGDSFAFSQRDEDKQLARPEAQKQFDARIEREREGHDFNESSSSGGGKKGNW